MTTPARGGSSGRAAKAAKDVPSADSRTRSACDTAAPAMGAIGGEESRSWHMRRAYGSPAPVRRAVGGSAAEAAQEALGAARQDAQDLAHLGQPRPQLGV